MKYPRIAQSLGISVHTVRRHIEKIYEKLGVHSRLEAVLTGRRIGLVHDGGPAAGA
jgi:two-component system NarL family response regulator